MRTLRAVLVSGAIVIGIAGLSRAPSYTPPGADASLLRFSWRMTIQGRDRCRPRTAEELEALPAHMRTPEVCTSVDATYSLVTRIDDADPDTLPLLRGGVKGDRPLFVMEDVRLAGGPHRVRVELHYRSAETEAVLASLDETLSFEPGRVQLVTLSPETRTLVVRTSASR